ncbi:MAG: hypothetical protein IPP49_08595 [Saprospiraceae bacterium]|nr:hypothetical protein [Saprospiraceae bacterium]
MRVYVNYLNNKGVGSSTTGGTGLGFGGFGDGNPHLAILAILAISEIVQKAIRVLQVVELARVVLIMIQVMMAGVQALALQGASRSKYLWDMVLF